MLKKIVAVLETLANIYLKYRAVIYVLGLLLVITLSILTVIDNNKNKTENFLVQTSDARQKSNTGDNKVSKDYTRVMTAVTNSRKYPKNQVFDVIRGFGNLENDNSVENKGGDYNIKPINDNFLKKYYTSVKSKNLKLDKEIMKFLKGTKTDSITKKLPLYNNNVKVDNPEEYSSFSQVSYINNKEVNYIFDIFIKHLNCKSGGRYLFKVLDIGKKELYIKYNKGDKAFIKKFVVSFFIYENTIKFTKRLKVEFLLKQYRDQYGEVKIKDISFPVDARLDVQDILPPAIMPTILNKINSVSNYFYGINNKLGLTAPYPTGENPNGIVGNDTRSLEQQKIDEAKRRKNIQAIKNQYQCFGNENLTAIPTKLECLDFGGVWDKYVENPEECPFFQANTNYINKRGGVKAGYCEFPDGLKRVGYRHYDKDKRFNPLCYNCKTNLIGQGTLGKCCQEQKDNRQEYPNMASPDYKFPGDGLDRLNSKKLFDRLNLSVY